MKISINWENITCWASPALKTVLDIIAICTLAFLVGFCMAWGGYAARKAFPEPTQEIILKHTGTVIPENDSPCSEEAT